MENKSLEIISLNMLERMKISKIAENAFKNNIGHAEGLEDNDVEYISSLGERGEKWFYECIHAFETAKKFPVAKKRERRFPIKYTLEKRY